MLLRDRQRVRDIARIHDFGGGRIAAAQKRTLFETAGQRAGQYADAEKGGWTPHLRNRRYGGRFSARRYVAAAGREGWRA